MARVRPVSHDDRLTLIEHLDELRTRIIIAVAAFVVGAALCAWQNQEIFDLLNSPCRRGAIRVTLGVTEPFFTTLTVSAYAGLLLALPVILYQLYAFLLPAFSPRERRVVLPLMLMAPFLFIGRRGVRLPRRARPGGGLPAQLQRRAVQHPGPGPRVLHLRGADADGDGSGFPGPAGYPRHYAAGHHVAGAAAAPTGGTRTSGSRSWRHCCRPSIPSRC